MLAVDTATGATSTLAEQSDPVWIDVVAGVPALLPDGRLVTTAELDGARRLVVDGEPVTGTDVQVAAVLSVDDDGVLLAGTDDPIEGHLWRWSTERRDLERLTGPGGYHTGLAAGGTVVVASRRASTPLPVVTVRRDGHERAHSHVVRRAAAADARRRGSSGSARTTSPSAWCCRGTTCPAPRCRC